MQKADRMPARILGALETPHWLLTGFGTLSSALLAWWVGGGQVFQFMLVALGVFFWLDAALGIGIAVGLRGEKLSSVKLRRLPLKMIQYFSLLVLSFVIDRFLGLATASKTPLYLIQFGSLLSMMLHEGTSLLEHLKELEPYTGFRVPSFVDRKLSGLKEWLPEELAENEGQPDSEKLPER